MAQKSEDTEALLNAIEEWVALTYADAAAEALIAAEGKPHEARTELAAKLAKAGRLVKLFRGNGRRIGRAFSGLQRDLEADANTAETAMNADTRPWNAERIAELHAEVRERLDKFARSRELKHLVERDRRGATRSGQPPCGTPSSVPHSGGPSVSSA
jgi:hypothetical protein